VLVKYIGDTRYSADEVRTHTAVGGRADAVVEELGAVLLGNVKKVYVDELHFYGDAVE